MESKKEQIFLKKILKKVGRAINQYGLIGEGDKILVAVSGGKDSLVLLDTLLERLKNLPIEYHIEVIHIKNKDIPGISNVEYIEELCHGLNVPFHTESISFKMDTSEKKFECFPCSWNRRKAIFKKAEKLGFNKIAFGHHMDDTLQTLLMNMVDHGEISAIPPKLKMNKGPFDLIRPLILCSSDEIKEYARIKGIEEAERTCPYENQSKRKIYGEIISKLSGLHPLARINMFNSMGNIFEEYLPEKPEQ